MWQLISRAVDYFIPMRVRAEASGLTKVRMFVFLHLFGPAMGQSVIVFLWRASSSLGWQFWTIEASVASFWIVPVILKVTQRLSWAAAVSVQVLVFVSLFGSFFYGGISSPFLPWLLISLLLGFFFLADNAIAVLAGVGLQLALFILARLQLGAFPVLLPLSALYFVNLISILSALIYNTLLSIYYEAVMRSSAELEQTAKEQRAQTEALRSAMKEAERASQQKSIFLAKMSHELRTPLNAVIGYSEMLKEELGQDALDLQRAEDLERINAAGRHLLDLVTNVLDLNYIEKSYQVLNLQSSPIAKVVEEVIATASPLFAKRNNQFVLNMSPDIGEIETDSLKLRQCILNLLSNAAKFTTAGVITLTVSKEGVGVGERLVIDVQDTGIGISAAGLKNIFKDFGQAEIDTAQKFGGTGLGLALTRRFCLLLGGSVSVQSVVGRGSNFTITIPCRQNKRSDHGAGPSSVQNDEPADPEARKVA